MPREFAVASGLTDVGMLSVAVEGAEAGRSLRGNGKANTREVRGAALLGCAPTAWQHGSWLLHSG